MTLPGREGHDPHVGILVGDLGNAAQHAVMVGTNSGRRQGETKAPIQGVRVGLRGVTPWGKVESASTV